MQPSTSPSNEKQVNEVNANEVVNESLKSAVTLPGSRRVSSGITTDATVNTVYICMLSRLTELGLLRVSEMAFWQSHKLRRSTYTMYLFMYQSVSYTHLTLPTIYSV